MMSRTYKDEQTQLKAEIVNLQKEVEVQERQIENLEQFIQRARRYINLTELTPYALRELVTAVPPRYRYVSFLVQHGSMANLPGDLFLPHGIKPGWFPAGTTG